MKPRVILAPAYAALLMVGLFGCGGNSPSDGPVVSVPRVSGQLQFTTSTPKSIYNKGEVVPFTLTVKNVGRTEITFELPAPDTDAIVSRAGAPVWQASKVYGGIGDIKLLDLQPGATTASTWSGRSMLDEWPQQATDGSNAGPGQYSVIQWFTPLTINGVQTTPAQAQGSLTSNPIRITVQ